MNNIRELAEVAHQNGDVALLVDSVSGLSGAELRTDRWRIDFALTGSQKCLALPPGLAFGVAQDSVLERAKSKADRGVYFDILEYEKNIQGNQTPNTPAVSLLYALAVQMQHIESEGIEARWARHQAMADRVYAWVQAMNERGVQVGVVAAEGHRSPTVTAVRVPDGMTGAQVVAGARQQGFAIATGYGKLKESTFRIGHMGDHTVAEVDALLDALTGLFRP